MLTNTTTIRTMLLCSAALAAACGSPARAQTAAVPPSAPDQAAGAPQPGAVEQPAAAAQPSRTAPVDGAGAGDDIIVTARRVEERLQDVPISITVFNQAQLNNRNIVSGQDLATYTPSLTANSRYGAENSSFAIRGFSADGRTTASVGVYFADVVAPRGGSNSIATGDGAGPGSFFDLQNVQVLKGPQGTLFGRNTTGGAILLVPQKPASAFGGYLEGSYGNYDMFRVQGVLNLPVNENIRLRIGGDRMTQDGYLHNISGVGPRRLGNINYYALRASLVIDVTPDLENYTIASFSRSNTNPAIPKETNCNPASFPFGTLTCQAIARQANRGFYTVQGAIPDPLSLLRQWQVINTTTWTATDSLTVKNIVSYSQIRNVIRQDYFGGTWVIPPVLSNATGTVNLPTGRFAGSVIQFNNIYSAPGQPIANQENVTEEFQLQGRGFDDRLTWQAGGYAEISDPRSALSAYSVSRMLCTDRFSLQCTDPLGQLLRSPLGNLTVQQFATHYRDYGIYGQASFSLTERLKATAGLRYTWDRTYGYAANAAYAFYPNLAGTGRCANPLVPGARTPFQNVLTCIDRPKQNSDAPTWVIGLDYKPIDDVLLYAKYSRGYRQGSTNPLGAGGFTTYEPEKVDTYEGGVKASWRGPVRGYFNLSGFYNNFTNQQLTQTFISSTNQAPPNAAIVNVGKSRIWGFEIEAGITPFTGMNLSGSYAYINSKLTETTNPVFPAGSPYDRFVPLVVGQPAPLTPKNKLSVTAAYTLPLPESIGAISVGATYTYTGKQVVGVTQFGGLDSFDLLNLNLNWKSVAGLPVDLSLFATNVTQNHYYVQNNDNYSSLGFVSFLTGQPRTFGARLRYNFGQ